LNAPERPGRDNDAPEAPVFEEPWQAQAFALAVAMHDRGVFTWPEWSRTLGATIQEAEPHDDDSSSYFHCWLRALEQLAAEKQLVAAERLSARKEAWRRAARATPHGSPILLENDPLARF
jgi:nitrile hydratase accessory protein